jgi:hypothetical protein
VKHEDDDDEDLDDGIYNADGAIAQAIAEKQRLEE